MKEIVPAPEWLEVANAYLQTGSVDSAAALVGIRGSDVTEILAKKEVRRYVDQVYLDQGYRNRDKLGAVMDKMIEAKLEEAEETGIYSSKDLAELLMMAHKMRMDEIKAQGPSSPSSQTNVQINEYGQGNYGALMKELMKK